MKRFYGHLSLFGPVSLFIHNTNHIRKQHDTGECNCQTRKQLNTVNSIVNPNANSSSSSNKTNEFQKIDVINQLFAKDGRNTYQKKTIQK